MKEITALPKKFQDALEMFIKPYKKDKNVCGIFLTGSFVHSTPDKNSDLDVYVVLKKSNFRERGNLFIKDVEIEYFINPVKQVEAYLADKEDISSADMFANSVVIYQKGNELTRLIRLAKKKMAKKIKPISKVTRENFVYQIDDLRKDLEDVYLKKDWFAFNQFSAKILTYSLNIFRAIKRIYREKDKRLQTQLQQVDPKFEEVYSRALLETNFENKYVYINKLVDYMEKLLGKKRAKTWKLRGKCTYLK